MYTFLNKKRVVRVFDGTVCVVGFRYLFFARRTKHDQTRLYDDRITGDSHLYNDNNNSSYTGESVE